MKFEKPNETTSFYKKVYDAVKKIPRGKVATYGQIAALAGNPLAARAVGRAMRETPQYLVIPCHRVIRKSGVMAPGYAFGGNGMQYKMLLQEGVAFKESGPVNMKKSLWKVGAV